MAFQNYNQEKIVFTNNELLNKYDKYEYIYMNN